MNTVVLNTMTEKMMVQMGSAILPSSGHIFIITELIKTPEIQASVLDMEDVYIYV